MKYILSLFLILTLLSCKETNQTQIFEGNIYITFINVYDVNSIIPKNKIVEFRENILSFNPEGKSESDIEMSKYYRMLIEHDLFGKSSFQIKLENNEIINVYLNQEEYSKLKNELKNLDKNKEQIKVKFKGSKISDGVFNRAIYSAIKIISVEKETGKTEWNK